MKNPSPKKLETRAKILDAALVSFAQHGYHGTSMPVLAKEAGIAVGSIYVHFADKRALVNELYRVWKREIIRRMEAIPLTLSFSEAFSQVWESFVDFAQKHPQAFLFLESHFHGPYLDTESLALEEAIFAAAARIIERGHKNGEIGAVDPRVVSAMFFGTIVQLFKQGEANAWNPKGLTQAKQLLAMALRG